MCMDDVDGIKNRVKMYPDSLGRIKTGLLKLCTWGEEERKRRLVPSSGEQQNGARGLPRT